MVDSFVCPMKGMLDFGNGNFPLHPLSSVVLCFGFVLLTLKSADPPTVNKAEEYIVPRKSTQISTNFAKKVLVFARINVI